MATHLEELRESGGIPGGRGRRHRSLQLQLSSIAAAHPLRDDRLELRRSLLPHAVTGLENVQACVRQSSAQKRRVSSESVRVVPTDDDGDGYLDRRKTRRQYRQVFRVGASER